MRQMPIGQFAGFTRFLIYKESFKSDIPGERPSGRRAISLGYPFCIIGADLWTY
jgi:hypothetical protein